MDFKTAKEIVLALKEIAKNIQGDKSSNTNNNSDNTDNNSDNNKDDLQYSVFIDPYADSYGTLYGTIMFKDLIENLVFEEQDVSYLGFVKDKTSEIAAYNPLHNLGELENSEVLIECFNKSIDVINELFDKYEQLEEFISSNILLSIIICNQSENRGSTSFSNRRPESVPESYCFIEKNKDNDSFKLNFVNLHDNVTALCDTTTKFDEASLIYTQEDQL